MSTAPPPPPPPVYQQQPAGETKICKYCAMAVPKAASICPHCRKRLGTHPVTMGCAILLGGVVLIGIIGSLSSSSKPPTPAPAVSDADYKAKEAAAAKANKEAADRDAAYLKTPAGKICAKHAGWDRAACEAIAKHQIYVGMTAEQVRLAWGKPYKINSTIMGHGTHEQWVMHDSIGSDLVYFEDGIMTSLQQSRK